MTSSADLTGEREEEEDDALGFGRPVVKPLAMLSFRCDAAPFVENERV